MYNSENNETNKRLQWIIYVTHIRHYGWYWWYQWYRFYQPESSIMRHNWTERRIAEYNFVLTYHFLDQSIGQSITYSVNMFCCFFFEYVEWRHEMLGVSCSEFIWSCLSPDWLNPCPSAVHWTSLRKQIHYIAALLTLGFSVAHNFETSENIRK